MDRGLQIVPVNGFGIKIYDKAPAMGTGRGGQGSLVAVAPQVGGLFRFDVDAGGKGRRSRDVSRGRKRYTSPNTIPNEHTYTDILEPEEPPNKKDILVPIALTPVTNRPLAAADGNSKGGNSRGGNSSGGSAAGQLMDRAGSGDEDESEDEDEDDPPVVIDKSKKSSFTRE
jgi:hypothetical protein